MLRTAMQTGRQASIQTGRQKYRQRIQQPRQATEMVQELEAIPALDHTSRHAFLPACLIVCIPANLHAAWSYHLQRP